MGTIFALYPAKLQSAFISQRGALTSIWCLGFCGCCPGDACAYPALVTQGACVLGFCGIVTIGETALGRLPLPQHCPDTKLKHIQSFCEKDLFTCPGDLARGAGFRFGTHLVTSELLSGDLGQGMPSSHSPLASLQLPGTSQKRPYTLVWSPCFCNCYPGHISRSPGSGGQRGLHLQSHRPVYIFLL